MRILRATRKALEIFNNEETVNMVLFTLSCSVAVSSSVLLITVMAR